MQEGAPPFLPPLPIPPSYSPAPLLPPNTPPNPALPPPTPPLPPPYLPPLPSARFARRTAHFARRGGKPLHPP